MHKRAENLENIVKIEQMEHGGANPVRVEHREIMGQIAFDGRDCLETDADGCSAEEEVLVVLSQ